MAHWARAQGPRIFSFLGAPNWLWWNKFKKLIILLQRKDQLYGKPGKYFLARGPVRLGVPRAPKQVKTLLPVNTFNTKRINYHVWPSLSHHPGISSMTGDCSWGRTIGDATLRIHSRLQTSSDTSMRLSCIYQQHDSVTMTTMSDFTFPLKF